MRETRELEDAAIQDEQKAIDDLEKLILQGHLKAAQSRYGNQVNKQSMMLTAEKAARREVQKQLKYV